MNHTNHTNHTPRRPEAAGASITPPAANTSPPAPAHQSAAGGFPELYFDDSTGCVRLRESEEAVAEILPTFSQDTKDGKPAYLEDAMGHLFSAAPDLLAALRPFANYACEPPCGCHNCVARAAIAKAEGQS